MASVWLSRVLIGAGLAMVLAAPAATAQPAAKQREQCFASSDWNGWKASPDSKTIYIRIGVNKLYRIDLASACPELNDPVVHLVTKIRGSPWICNALDLDLRVSDDHGFETPCFVSKLTPLTAEEAAAVPKNLRP